MKNYLDILAPAHGLETFGQKPLLFAHAKITVSKQGPAFSVNLKQVRDYFVCQYPNQETIFDLKGVEDERLIAKWYFAPEGVPAFDVMTLYEASGACPPVALVPRPMFYHNR